MRKIIASLTLFLSIIVTAQSQTQPRWLQQPALSPDGKWIAFEYKGNLFKVPVTGGPAIALTINDSYNGYPVWSHDSKKIAFASDRYGNFDIYNMQANGSEVSRLTFNSGKD